MSKYRKYKPYIRSARMSDDAEGFREGIRLKSLLLAWEEGLLPRPYVLVQHGVKGNVLATALSKAELRSSLLHEGNYRDWQLRMKRKCK